MLFWDVSNGLTARRARAGDENALKTLARLQEEYRQGDSGGRFLLSQVFDIKFF
jgi:hypothetical protein